MSWKKFDLKAFTLSVASCGGAIAMTRDEKKIIKINEGQLKATIQIFSASGKQLANLDVNKYFTKKYI